MLPMVILEFLELRGTIAAQTIVTTGLTNWINFSVNYFLEFLTRSSELIRSFFRPITEK